MMEIKIADQTLPDHYGDTVTFNDGLLMINMFDGMTKLSKNEAKQLAEALLEYTND